MKEISWTLSQGWTPTHFRGGNNTTSCEDAFRHLLPGSVRQASSLKCLVLYQSLSWSWAEFPSIID